MNDSTQRNVERNDPLRDSLRLAPEFIEPKTLKDLTEEQQVELVEGIRVRRMVAVSQLLVMQEEKKKVTAVYLEVKFDKIINKLSKNIEKIDTELAKVEHLFTQYRALRLEALDIA